MFESVFGDVRGSGRPPRLPQPACPFTGATDLVVLAQPGGIWEVGWFGSHWTLHFLDECVQELPHRSVWFEHANGLTDKLPSPLEPGSPESDLWFVWAELAEDMQRRVAEEVQSTDLAVCETSIERPLLATWR